MILTGGRVPLPEGVRDGDDVSATEVSSIRRTLHALTEPEEVLRQVADPEVRVITLTITEKAYESTAPESPIGLLAAGLSRRAAAGAGPVAVVSCDNLLSNGARLRGPCCGRGRGSSRTWSLRAGQAAAHGVREALARA
ncbi:hypothetical protein ACFMQL_16260 [Nonomuraea fastidiosa]|uniref:hypothetical protein n=1 Tax=Nonomuraea TaxID=83681 RepID=UPI0032521316